ncbi:MAG TPA: GNAT family N-acetyltransferase [Solirubrobacteraceae bacterium]|nr:GNAT family N-acetyltransferase [Solirubrobacteraceae bacterium]
MARDEAHIRELGEPGDLGWVVMAHGEIYAEEFGWSTEFEALVLQIVAEFARGDSRGPRAAWIAELGRRRVGCVFCVADDEPAVARLRILLVDPVARGQRLGQRLVATALQFARDAGYERVRLWTNHPLAAARRIYLDAGFELVAEEEHHSFGVSLTGQIYELDLGAPAAEPGSLPRARRG